MSKVARSFLIINIGQLLFIASGYIIHAYLGRLLKPADYGRYGIIVTLATMTIVLIGDGIPKALSKFISQYPEQERIIKRKAALLQTALVLLVTILYYFAAPLVASFFKDDSLIPLIQLSAPIIPAFAAASFYNHYFNGLRQFGIQSVQSGVRGIMRIAAVLISAYYFGLNGAIVGYIIAPILVSVFAFTTDKRRQKQILSESKSDTKDISYKTLINFALGIVGFMVAYNLVINIDLFLTKRILMDDYLVGIYNAVINIGRIPFYLFSNLAFILLPTVSNILEKRTREEARMLIQQSMRYLMMLIIPITAALIIYSSEIITLLYSSKYIDGDTPLKIMLLGATCLTVFYVATFILNGSGKVHFSANMTWIGVAVNIGLNYFFIPRYGIVGSAIATAFTSTVLMLISLVLLHKTFGNFFSIASFLKSIFAATLISVLFLYLPRSVAIMIPGGIAFMAIYILGLTLIGEITKTDFLKLKGIFIKSYQKRKVGDEVSEY